jgi:hypothetical protein
MEAGKQMMWNCIETDPFKKGTAYFVGTKYKMDDYAPYIFKTEDYGKTWKKITAGIDPMHFTRALRADPKRAGLLYAGTEFGMYISFDDGANWKKFQLNLPETPITDLTIKENDLIVATQGRAFWIIDDLGMIQQHQAANYAKNIHVFDANPVVRSEGGGRRRGGFGGGMAVNMGANPALGSVINYYVKGVTDSSKLSIAVLDKKNKVIRTFSKNAKDPQDKIEFTEGINQFEWDMNYPAAERLDGLILWNVGVGTVKAAPGKYTARFVYQKDTVLVPFVIKPNPNYAATEADLDDQTAFLLSVRDKFSEIQKAIKDIRAVRTQVNEFTAKLDGQKELKAFADSVVKKMTSIEEVLYQTKSKSGQDVLNYPIRLNDKIAGLFNVVASGQTAPSKQAKEAFADLAAQSDVALTSLKAMMDKDLKALNQMIHEKMVPVIGIK